MIEVRHLTRHFHGFTAVDDVSFDVGKGEILGLLGPNGAGKTTIMRILAGYLSASGGEVRVAGYDVMQGSVEARRKIGYLPENCPLYPEMRVDEFLHFRASLKGLRGQKKKRRVRVVKEACGLEDAGRRIIGQLSKGFRQRVGLAECLVHDPELVILDEPTIGLDPNQILEVRELVRGLVPRHTVLFSSHILHEVELTCDRVLILDRGRVAAQERTDRLAGLLKQGDRFGVELSADSDVVKAALLSLEGVKAVTVEDREGWTRASLAVDPGVDPREAVFRLAVARGWTIRELRRESSTLEDVFVSLTGGSARRRP